MSDRIMNNIFYLKSPILDEMHYTENPYPLLFHSLIKFLSRRCEIPRHMTFTYLLFFCGIPFWLASAALATEASPPPSLSTSTVTNPVLAGFHPDPTICHNGPDFYLAHSSFEYFPGVTIFHSRDLVQWEPVSNALNTKDQLDLTGIPASGGIFAPTLRYHQGIYYLVTTLVRRTEPKVTGERSGNFIVTATSPNGPWSSPHWIDQAPGIDPSLLFDDDGSVYLCGNMRPEKVVRESHRNIWIRKLDLATWTLVGPEGILDAQPYYAKETIGAPNNFEGPHLYKKDGTYYLLISHGGTGTNHALSIWRSPSPLGPWEGNPANPILTHRKTHNVGLTCTGHGDLVQAEDGRWWMVALGIRDEMGLSPMGRETLLVPVDWSGAWPVINPGPHRGLIDPTLALPYPASAARPKLEVHCDFDQERLPLDWKTIRTPSQIWWDLKQKPGWLTLALRPDRISEISQPSWYGVPVTERTCEATTILDFHPRDPKECAGLAILRSQAACWTLVVEDLGSGAEAAVYEGEKRLGALAVDVVHPVELKIRLEFPRLVFSVRQDLKPWTVILNCDAARLGTDRDGRFTGSMIGVYASSRGGKTERTAAFDVFHYISR